MGWNGRRADQLITHEHRGSAKPWHDLSCSNLRFSYPRPITTKSEGIRADVDSTNPRASLCAASIVIPHLAWC